MHGGHSLYIFKMTQVQAIFKISFVFTIVLSVSYLCCHKRGYGYCNNKFLELKCTSVYAYAGVVC